MTLLQAPSRLPTTIAVGVLLLDAALLGLAAVWLDRPTLWAFALACVALAALALAVWRRYLRRLAELERARGELRAAAESLRELLHTRPTDS